MKPCEARQYSDQKVCHRCNLVWDMNDPEPPECPLEASPEREALRASGRAAMERIRRLMKK